MPAVSRRGALRLLGLGGAAALAAACQPATPRTVTGGGSAAPTVAAASGSPFDELYAGARKDGRVSVYGPPGTEYRRVYVEGWQKAYPDIPIDYSGANGSEQAPKLAAERQGGKFLADIYTGGPSSPLRSIVPIDGFDPLEPALLPDVRTNWLKNRLWFADDAQKFYLAFAGGGGGRGTVLYNTREVDPKTIGTWNDLLDPRWAGKIASPDVGTGAVGGGLTEIAYSDLGQDYIRKLFGKEQGVVMSADARQQVDWIAQGQYLIGLFPGEYRDAIASGLPIDVIRLQYPGKRLLTVGFGGIGLVNQAPHPNAARLYLNWVLYRDAQVAYQNSLLEPSYRTDVARDNIDPLDLADPNAEYELAQSSRILGLRTDVEKLAKQLASER